MESNNMNKQKKSTTCKRNVKKSDGGLVSKSVHIASTVYEQAIPIHNTSTTKPFSPAGGASGVLPSWDREQSIEVACARVRLVILVAEKVVRDLNELKLTLTEVERRSL